MENASFFGMRHGILVWKHGEWQHHPVRKTKRRVNDAQRL